MLKKSRAFVVSQNMRKASKMSEKDKMRNHKRTEDTKPAQKKEEHKRTEKKCEWKGVFEDVTYSNGPGDNIFVFG